MIYKDFSSEVLKKIKLSLDKAKSNSVRPVAAFDADGTLWDTDLGEAFFDYLIENEKVPLPEEPWTHYKNLKMRDPKIAYLWLAQICKGLKLETIQGWADQSVAEMRPPIFEAQKNLIDTFKDAGVQIYIVTASIKWAVEPGVRLLGLTNENVIGIETTIENGLITANQKGPITYRHGKVEALLEKTKGQMPFYCSGNSEGDQELLAASTDLAMAVSACRRDDPLFKTENRLLKLATTKGWLAHRFVEDDN
jgi:HAD superfamily phosphoserine phosphatase-like hydrolase